MSAFWAIGIVINVTFVVLAMYWVIKQWKLSDKESDDSGSVAVKI